MFAKGLFKKVERLEQIVDAQDQYITGVSNAINASSAKLEEIDEKGTLYWNGLFLQLVKNISFIL